MSKPTSKLERLARHEIPRRILGAIISPLAPGAGHVILGYPKIGVTIGAIYLLIVGAIYVGALYAIPLFLGAGALFIFGLVFIEITLFALPPGPGLKQGLRTLAPMFTLVAIFYAVFQLGPRYVIGLVPVTDDSLAPQIRKDDLMVVQSRGKAQPGDVVLVDDGTKHFRRFAMAMPGAVLGRALFVAKSGSDGRGRIWHRL